jgi:fatty acid-binding protein DegV
MSSAGAERHMFAHDTKSAHVVKTSQPPYADIKQTVLKL